MRLVKDSFEVIGEDAPVLQKIEMCGRTCYRSMDKVTEDSAERFCKMLCKRGHTAMVEHGTACLRVDESVYYLIKHTYSHLSKYLEWSMPYVDAEQLLAADDSSMGGDHVCIVSGNLRAWEEFIIKVFGLGQHTEEFFTVAKYLKDTYPVLFEKVVLPQELISAPPLTYLAMAFDARNLPIGHQHLHRFMSVRFVIDRGVSHEWVRMRPCSFAQASSRYISYVEGVGFITPPWYEYETLESTLDSLTADELHVSVDANGLLTDGAGNVPSAEATYILGNILAEATYKTLISVHGQKPEQARNSLPNGMETELVVTANYAEWEHIFNLRAIGTTGRPHPQMCSIMRPLLMQVANEDAYWKPQAGRLLKKMEAECAEVGV